MSTDFLGLYRQHSPDVYGYLAYRLGSRTRAEQLTEVTFDRAARSWATRGSTRLPPHVWLLTIARDAVGRQPLAGGPEPGDLGLSPELARALGRLERGERSVIALRFGARLEQREIARVLEMSPSVIQRLLSSGLRRLRTELERPGDDAPSRVEESRSAPSRPAPRRHDYGDRQHRHP